MLNPRTSWGGVLVASILALGAWNVHAQNQDPMGSGRPGMAHAGPGAWEGHKGGEEGHLKHLFKVMGATPAQQDSVKRLMTAAHQDLKPLHQEAKALHSQGMALFSAAKIDPVAIEAHRQKAMALKEAMSKRHTQLRIDIANVFSPEQRAQYAAWVQAHPHPQGHKHD